MSDKPGQGTEEIDDGVRLAHHMVVWLFIFLIAGTIVWSAWGELDIVSFAPGEVIPSTQIKQVQHLEGGVIRRIMVKEGETVLKGQPLVELETASSNADVGEITARLASLEVDNIRLQAEATSEKEVFFPATIKRSHPDLVTRAGALFASNHYRRKEKLSSLQESMAGHQQYVLEIGARIKNNKKKATLVEEQVGISAKLLERDITNRYTHLDLLKELNQIKSSVEEDGLALLRAEAAYKEARSNLASVGHEFEEAAREKLAENRRQMTELSARLQKFQNSLSRTVLTAPVDGVVKTIYLVTEGGVIPPGGTAMDLVPGGDRLVVEAKLPMQDIGYVNVGQPAFITLASSDASLFGKLSGTVVQISADALATEEGQPYYRVRVETENAFFQREGGMKYRLFPGMIVRCAIRTGQRSVLEYLFYPFLNYMDSSLTER